MTKEQLFQQAEDLKSEGGLILKESKLLGFLSDYGQIEITGSYKLNLMAQGDIDIHVVQPHFSKEKAIEVLNKLIQQDFFRGFYFGDYIKNPKEGFPAGYYIGLNTIRKNLFWKIDIWFVKKLDREQEKFIDFIRENLTDELKYKILEFKQKRNKKEEDILSVDIYKEVFGK